MGPDENWRRPVAGGDEGPGHEAGRPALPAYTPPPPMHPAPPTLPRGPLIVPVTPPPEPPAQDHAAIDATERRAVLVTAGVGAVAAVVAVLLAVLLFVRLAG
jgi:hypothetical protein